MKPPCFSWWHLSRTGKGRELYNYLIWCSLNWLCNAIYVLRLRLCAFGRYSNSYLPGSVCSSKSPHQCLKLHVFKCRIPGSFLPRIVFCVPDVSGSIYIQPSTHFSISYLFGTVGLIWIINVSFFRDIIPMRLFLTPLWAYTANLNIGPSLTLKENMFKKHFHEAWPKNKKIKAL